MSNNISLFEVIEKISGVALVNEGAESIQLVPIQLELVSLWSRTDLDEPTRGEARMTLLAPDGTQISPPVLYSVDLTEYARSRQITRVNGIPVRGAGKYTFQTEIRTNEDWELVSRIPLEVAIQVQVPEQSTEVSKPSSPD